MQGQAIAGTRRAGHSCKRQNVLPVCRPNGAGHLHPRTQRWDKGFTNIATNNGHLNKFYNKADSSIYTIGGYGQLMYKDSVKRYNFASNSWQKVKTKGDTFTPRYLAGLGTNATGDTAYVIGGYGSASGQQIVNPRNIYDMMRFRLKTSRLKNCLLSM
jgi:hypothetical protein